MKKIVCWGAGNCLCDNLKEIQEKYEIIGIIDSSNDKVFKKIGSYTVMPKEKIQDIVIGVDYVVITVESSKHILEIFDECVGLGVTNIRVWSSKHPYLLGIEFFIGLNNICSFCGEEIYLRNKFAEKKQGFYVDVGAYHPIKSSNTFWAYCKGWSGINIEPNKHGYKLFEHLRPKDININCGISNEVGQRIYYEYFGSGESNSFCQDRFRTKEALKCAYEVEVERLDNIFRKYTISHIDFIDIDVEGYELSVLQSIDFSEVDIDCIMLEQLPLNEGMYGIEDIINSKEFHFLKKNGYTATNKFNKTVFYEKIRK